MDGDDRLCGSAERRALLLEDLLHDPAHALLGGFGSTRLSPQFVADHQRHRRVDDDGGDGAEAAVLAERAVLDAEVERLARLQRDGVDDHVGHRLTEQLRQLTLGLVLKRPGQAQNGVLGDERLGGDGGLGVLALLPGGQQVANAVDGGCEHLRDGGHGVPFDVSEWSYLYYYNIFQ